MEKHPSWGADVARLAHLPQTIINIILYHHERYDGKGTHGFEGRRDPLEARIVNVADIYDALTSDRSYRVQMSRKEAKKIMTANKGTYSDPCITDAFIDILGRRPMETMRQEKPGILFVDDEENVLKALSRLFLDESYDVYTATSGAEGLEIMKRNDIAVVVSDQGMPQMKGAEFLEHVKTVSPETVRIMLTGYADLNAAIDAINKGGVYQYITKPWDNDNLVVSVNMAAEKYRLIKENAYLTELTKRQNEELQNWNAELKRRFSNRR